VLVKAYSKRRKKASKKEEERLGVVSGFLCRACLFIYFCSGLRALYTLDSLSRFLSLPLSLYLTYKQADFRQQQAKKKKKKMMMKTKRKGGMQEEEYGRNRR
jgi:hypothetical protein